MRPIRLVLVVALLAILAGPIVNPPDADANETAAVTWKMNSWNNWTDLDRSAYWPTRWAADSLYYGPRAGRG